jgi:diguanylate cyclase (GGDEF)-like protein
MLNPVSVLFGVMTLANLMSVAIFGSLRHAGIPGVGRWMVANTVTIISMVLFALTNILPVFLTVSVADLMACLAFLLSYEGARQFFGLRLAYWPYAVFLATQAAIAWWTYPAPSIDMRVATVSLGIACTYGAVGWIVWTRRMPGRAFYGHGFTLTVAVLAVVAGLARTVIFGLGLSHQQTLLLPSALNVALLTINMLILPGMSSGMMMLAHDRMSAQLDRWANVDDLTGALVRRSFFAKLYALAGKAGPPGQTFSAVIFDLDHFKSINDAHGHAVGDKVLAHLGRGVRANLRDGDVFGRLGGEEFAVLFPGQDRQMALARVEAWLAELRLPQLERVVAGTQAKGGGEAAAGTALALPGFTFSAGLDEYRPGESVESLMLRADKALYQAKAQGRNCVLLAAGRAG